MHTRSDEKSLLPYVAAIGMLLAAIAMREAVKVPAPSPDAVRSYLLRELEARVGAVLEWEHGRRTALEHAADALALRRELPMVLAGRSDAHVLHDVCRDLGRCALSTPDGIVLASSGVSRVPPDLVRAAARGRTVHSRLVAKDGTEAHYAVYFATPVVERGAVRAVLTGLVHPDEELGPILGRRPPGRTGETYAVDPEGHLVTSSRFDPQPRAALTAPRVLGRLETWLRDVRDHRRPASDTWGADVQGYRDYRGVRVVGAWHWIDELGAGVVTEMDASEAYHLSAP